MFALDLLFQHPWLFLLVGSAVVFVVQSLHRIGPTQVGLVTKRFGFAMQLVLTSYLVGSTALTLAGVLNPDGAILVLISAAAGSFGGTICLFWTGYVAARLPPHADTPHAPRVVTRKAGWLVAGAVALIILFAVLGPGIPR